MKKETTKSEAAEAVIENNQAEANQSVFAQASAMDANQALNILIQTANVAQKAGVLSVNDAVLVARALELVSNAPAN
tara:strand:+ start:47 stop:277 length:231 start_codon:yes stop_codon:yes gene_type:complete